MKHMPLDSYPKPTKVTDSGTAAITHTRPMYILPLLFRIAMWPFLVVGKQIRHWQIRRSISRMTPQEQEKRLAELMRRRKF